MFYASACWLPSVKRHREQSPEEQPSGGFTWGGIAVAMVLIIGSLVVADLFERPEPSLRALPNLDSMGELRDAFNADIGTPRLVLLLSPT
jgi:hypothetical protein